MTSKENKNRRPALSAPLHMSGSGGLYVAFAWKRSRALTATHLFIRRTARSDLQLRAVTSAFARPLHAARSNRLALERR